MEETKVIKNQDKTPKKDASKWAVGAGSYVAGIASALAAESVMAEGTVTEDGVASSDAVETSGEASHSSVVETSAETSHSSAVEGGDTAAMQQANPLVDPALSPAAEEVILATDEGVRVAQVDDSASFAQAFADARSQVGPGGVFEWRGKVYGTYYKEEWDNMSRAERAEYQSKIDYDDIRQHDGNIQSSSLPESHPDVPGDDEIRVLGVETVQGPNGQLMTIAGLESDNDQALLVDIDNDGQFDILLHDDNGDGQLQENEVYDISSANVEVSDLEQAMSNQDGMQYADNDGMPDYMNDADISSMA